MKKIVSSKTLNRFVHIRTSVVNVIENDFEFFPLFQRETFMHHRPSEVIIKNVC